MHLSPNEDLPGLVAAAAARHQRAHGPAGHQRVSSIGDMARHRKSYRLSDEALAGFDRLAARNSITITALLEALGQLGAHRNPTGDEIIERARAIDRERRSRR